MAHHQRDIGLRNDDGSGRGQKRHVSAAVSQVFPNRVAHDGAEHQHIWINAATALDGGPDEADDVFVAIRVTDGGINQAIPFETGMPVELQGLLTPADQAEPGQDNPGLPVLHFTHAPVGFVIYEGQLYK